MVLTFLQVLQREQALVQVEIIRLLAGHAAAPQRRRYMEASERIKTIVNDFDNSNLLDFLRGIAHNLSF